MTAPTSSQLARAAAQGPVVVRDRFLDTVKAVAIVRVVLWHTWSWWWLSWIPAMPAMFFASGALLEDSLGRRGWWPTVRQRVRRLIVPFWAYSAASVALMVVLGWRPTAGDLVGWVVPLVDPVGDPDTPGLWIPLWYVRAYLWFVLGSWMLSRLVRKFGNLAVAGAAGVTLAAFWWARSGTELPVEVGDAIAYAAFVMAGMRYCDRGAPNRRDSIVLVVVAAVAALWWWGRFGPADGVVNRSYPLTMLVGAAGLGLALVFRNRLADLPGRLGRVVDLIGRRALTIYLWQGLGLVAAQRLVDSRMDPGPLRAAASLAVVAVVIVAAVVVAGPLEDLAARRPRQLRRANPVMAIPGVALAVLALVLPTTGAAVEAPLSGKAVVTRAGAIQRSLQSGPTASADGIGAGDAVDTTLPVSDRLAAAVEQWVARHGDLPSRVDLGRIDGAVVAASGEIHRLSWTRGEPVVVEPLAGSTAAAAPPVAWWSVTKAATAVWLMRSIEAGVVELDDRLSRWVPEAPNAGSITLEQLARHSSGIPGELDGDFLTTAPDVALAEYAARPDLAFEPGQGFDYSRTGYFLLALALERANATPWRAAMESLADRAGVRIGFDEDTTPFDRVTDPDGHGYRGGLWASGGILSGAEDGARFFRWALTEGLEASSLSAMADFSADPEHWFYGIGLMPLCPCEAEGDRLGATRYGLDSATGFFVHDQTSTATAFIAPDNWFDDDGPAPEFYELQTALLDAAS